MQFLRPNAAASAQAQTAEGVNEGLRAYMLQVYNYMAAGLALTGIVALVAVQIPALMSLFYQIEAGRMVGMTPLGWIIAFAPIGFVFFFAFKVQSMSPSAAKMWFWLFAGVMGLSFSNIFLIYTGTSIARVFFITAGMFGAMSLWGYTTKRDLTGMGSFLMMGLIGVLLAGVVNIFLQSPMMYFVTSVIGVLLGVGLTAYDTQKIKNSYFMLQSRGDAEKGAVIGAFELYMDFIYLFIHLMRLMGERR